MKRERAMRKAAERGDQDKSTEGTYIDPYAGSSPSVKEELKQWLSPAAQRKRLMGRIPTQMLGWFSSLDHLQLIHFHYIFNIILFTSWELLYQLKIDISCLSV